MSSSISSTLTIIFILTISLLFPTPHATSSSSLIKKVCAAATKNFNLPRCVQILNSEPRIVSAKNLYNLTVGIIETGISRSTNTRKYVKSLLKKNGTDPDVKGALKDCKSSYDWAIGSMKSGLSEVKDKEFETASYDLLLSGTDCIRDCEEAVDSKRIKDRRIARGNNLVQLFGLCAFEAVNRL